MGLFRRLARLATITTLLGGTAAVVAAASPAASAAPAAVTGTASTGGATLSIEFAAPSPLGLLSPVLDADPLRPAGHGTFPGVESDER